MIQQCKDLLTTDEPVEFNPPLIVSKEDYTIFVSSACVLTKYDELKLRDMDGKWHELKPNQFHVQLVSLCLHTRLNQLKPNNVCLARYDNGVIIVEPVNLSV
jgi:hypothetical protein